MTAMLHTTASITICTVAENKALSGARPQETRQGSRRPSASFPIAYNPSSGIVVANSLLSNTPGNHHFPGPIQKSAKSEPVTTVIPMAAKIIALVLPGSKETKYNNGINAEWKQ